MANVRRLVLDVLKPHNPNNIEVSEKISQVKGVHYVNSVSEEVDQDTESIRITIEGTNLDFTDLKEIIEDCGGAVHSIDEVTVSKKRNAKKRKVANHNKD